MSARWFRERPPTGGAVPDAGRLGAVAGLVPLRPGSIPRPARRGAPRSQRQQQGRPPVGSWREWTCPFIARTRALVTAPLVTAASAHALIHLRDCPADTVCRRTRAVDDEKTG